MLSWSKEYKILDLQFLEREFMKRKGKSGCFSHNYKTNKKKAKKKNLTSETTCFLLPGPQEVKLAVMDILLEIFLKSKIIFV